MCGNELQLLYGCRKGYIVRFKSITVCITLSITVGITVIITVGITVSITICITVCITVCITASRLVEMFQLLEYARYMLFKCLLYKQ